MGIRSILSQPFAAYIVSQQRKWAQNPVKSQYQVFNNLITSGRETLFGQDHSFDHITNHNEFRDAVPIKDYEGLSSYIQKATEGKSDVLWPGKPAYFAKTSGTTSGTKYIPITKDSIPNHINSARNALLSYVHETGKSKFLDGKLMFISGAPTLTQKAGIHVGRLSGIVNHHVPQYLRTNQMPSYGTNCIEDFEEKIEKIIDETIDKNMTLISGIPPWVQMYFDRLQQRTGKKIKDIFPEFSLFVYGGVNFEPYRAKLFQSIGRTLDSIETYPASEGFIAYQDSQEEEGLLLLLKSGIFFEFIPADQFFDDNPTRLTIDEVEIGVNYALIINSNAGLWGYSIGDTIKFVSLEPCRILVTGRIKHFISAFGEHVIGEEVERALQHAMQHFPEADVKEFTVAPNVAPEEGLPHHEWFIEFGTRPGDMESFSNILETRLQELNSYYDDLIKGKILTNLKIVELQSGAFVNYMRSIGKLGGQNKVPRLSNDRKIADALMIYKQ